MLNQYFAVSPKGMEEVTAKELSSLGASEVKTSMGGVYFSGDLEILYKSNLWLRSASRVLVPLKEFACLHQEMLYDQVKRIKWEHYLTPEKTFAIDTTLVNSRMNHSHFVSLKAKDAIVDQLRSRFQGERPSINTEDPDLRIHLFINNNRCILSLDSSGESLHKRGYRQGTGPAPLKENAAAALLLLAGYDGSQPLMDPMCGSGTFLIEAALISLNLAPGLMRSHFGFMEWPDYDETLWSRLLDNAENVAQRVLRAPIHGSDCDRRVLDLALKNAKAAGVAKWVTLEKKFLDQIRPGDLDSGILVANPPYGERIGARGDSSDGEIKALYREWGDVMKRYFAGWTAYLLTGNLDAAKSVGLHPSKKYPLFNGGIESRFLKFDLYDGSRKKSKQTPSS